MHVSVVGAGYVGLVTAACFAEMGNVTSVLESDATRLAALRAGKIPIYEPGLEELVHRGIASGRLSFTADAVCAFADARAIFICVGTPPNGDGSTDLSQVLSVARTIGRHLKHDCVIVNKSTVPVGTAARVAQSLSVELSARGERWHTPVVSNPEFLKEGAAIEDFMRPDRIIVGCDDEAAIAIMRSLYEPFQRDQDRLIFMDAASAELTKYAANAMLATRISFMNELARLAEVVGADIEKVRRGIGSDPRIGAHFLYAGCGYGGSCFPKDVQALIRTGQEFDLTMRIASAVEQVNESQKRLLANKLVARFGADLKGRCFALWGLAFKPGTDDMREAPSIPLVRALIGAGATVRAYDPVATETARIALADAVGAGLVFVPSALAACEDADAVLIVTEWKEFRAIDIAACVSRLREPVVFDGRNLYSPAEMEALGIDYHCIGRAAAV